MYRSGCRCQLGLQACLSRVQALPLPCLQRHSWLLPSLKCATQPAVYLPVSLQQRGAGRCIGPHLPTFCVYHIVAARQAMQSVSRATLACHTQLSDSGCYMCLLHLSGAHKESQDGRTAAPTLLASQAAHGKLVDLQAWCLLPCMMLPCCGR